MFELYQLRCFVALAQELHFGRAAARLGRTQPPFSRQIRMLEADLGVRLVDRTNRAVGLTHAGQAFLPEARRVVQLASAAADVARLAAKGEAGQLSIGATPIASYALIPRLIAAFRQSHPAVLIAVREILSGGQAQALISGELDVGILRPPLNNPELRAVTIHEERLVLAANVNDPLYDAGPLDLSCLAGRRYLMHSPDESPYFHDLVGRLFEAAGVMPDLVRHTGLAHSIVAMVNAGVGVALVPESAAVMAFENVRYAPIALPKGTVAKFMLAWRADNDDPVLHAFLALAREFGVLRGSLTRSASRSFSGPRYFASGAPGAGGVA